MSHTLLMPLGVGLRLPKDPEKGDGSTKTKYRLYDCDVYQGTYTAKEIARKLNCPVRTPSSYAYTGTKYRRRWRFEKEEEVDEEWKRAWAEEWDQERERILRGAKK